MKYFIIHACVQLTFMALSIALFKYLYDSPVLLFTCGMMTQLILNSLIYKDK